jgi:hypothetical protein
VASGFSERVSILVCKKEKLFLIVTKILRQKSEILKGSRL